MFQLKSYSKMAFTGLVVATVILFSRPYIVTPLQDLFVFNLGFEYTFFITIDFVMLAGFGINSLFYCLSGYFIYRMVSSPVEVAFFASLWIMGDAIFWEIYPLLISPFLTGQGYFEIAFIEEVMIDLLFELSVLFCVYGAFLSKRIKA